MPLGYLLTVATAKAYASDMFRLPIITSSHVWILTMVLAIIFGLIAHLFVQQAIHTMDWLECVENAGVTRKVVSGQWSVARNRKQFLPLPMNCSDHQHLTTDH